MDLSKSKLAQHHGSLAQALSVLMTEAENLGASAGVQRITLVCNQYDKVSPDVAYHLIDPVGFEREVEDAQAHKIELVHIMRNCVSLLPLVLTWFALFSAATSYQDCLTAPASQNRCDITQPFLALWQNNGFGGRTFTFATAAIADVMLLLLYLTFIILTFYLERRAHITSTGFARELQSTTEGLMQAIASDGVTPITSEADVDRVAHAVSRVVDSAMEMSKQLLQEAKLSIEQTMQVSHQSTLQAVQSAQESSQKIAQSAQQSTLQTVQSVQQSVEQLLQASQQSSQQIIQSAQRAIADSNHKMEDLFDHEIGPMIKTFNSDMVSLHRELGSYQGRLNDLTVASNQLSKASETLVANADRYIHIGKEISDQISALNSTQQQVLTQIGGIAGHIGNAAKDMSTATTSMSTATTSMSSATHAVEVVATQMTNGMQITINTMTTQVGRATQSLGQVGTELQTTTYHLQKAAMLLSSLQFGSRGGLIGWFFSRQYNRRKGAGATNP